MAERLSEALESTMKEWLDPDITLLLAEISALRGELKKAVNMTRLELFPIQSQRGATAHPLRVPWSVAEKAYAVYSAKHGGSQSLERLAERGGFAPSEMDVFHPTWREEASELSALRGELDEARQQLVVLTRKNETLRNALETSEKDRLATVKQRDAQLSLRLQDASTAIDAQLALTALQGACKQLFAAVEGSSDPGAWFDALGQLKALLVTPPLPSEPKQNEHRSPDGDGQAGMTSLSPALPQAGPPFVSR